jgi:hypothetical protein
MTQPPLDPATLNRARIRSRLRALADAERAARRQARGIAA